MTSVQVEGGQRAGKTSKSRLAAFMLLLATTVVSVFIAGAGSGTAATADTQHGIATTKGCDSPTLVGANNTCTYTIRNTIDEAQDTIEISGFTDTVHSAGGDVVTGTAADHNVLNQLNLEIGAFLPGFSTPP